MRHLVLLRLVLLCLAACIESSTPSAPEPPPPDDAAVAPDATTCPAVPPSENGVRLCSSFGDACTGPRGGGLGLQCLPGYEDEPWVPCMCSEVTWTSWCLRDF